MLINNSIDDEIAKGIAKSLLVSNIRTLVLNDNSIGEDGGQAIALSIKFNKSLTYINMVANKMGPLAAAAFAATLESNQTLTSLILSSNHIGNDGLASLMKSMQSNKTLEMLGLMQIGATDFSSVADVLEGNNTLIDLYLNENDINNADQQLIVASYEKNTTMLCLDIKSVVINSNILSQIDTIMNRNKGINKVCPAIHI
jgi:Ran GTPase-activating protein (RanGAP) involved in mRNA processing and transport